MSTNVVLDLLSLVYDAGLDDTKWVPALVKLREALGVHSCAILAENRQKRRISCTANSGIKDKYLNRLQENYYSWLSHPVIASARPREMRPGHLLLSNKLIEDRDLLGTPAYKEFFKPQGIFYFCFVPLWVGEAARVNIILNWTKKHGPLKISDLRLFQKIIPHLVRAVRIQNRLQFIQAGRDALETVVDDLSDGVILLNRRGEVVFLNRNAHKFINRKDALHVDDRRRLRVDGSERAKDLERLLRNAVSDSADKGRRDKFGANMLLPRQGEGEPYKLLVLSVPKEPLLPDFDSPSAVLFINEGEGSPVRLELHLAKHYGLTSTEARLAAMLLKGLSLSDSADQMEISMNTVRTHLKRIFTKTNTCRQGQLVAKMATGVYRYALGTK